MATWFTVEQYKRTGWRSFRLPPIVSISTIPRDADRVAILVNPKAGPKAAAKPCADRLAERLQKEGFKTEMFTDLGEATAQANRWHAEGCLRTLVGAGGDGTAAELANRTAEGVPLTLLPAGNSNLLARYFRLCTDPDFLCRTIVDGLAARIDAGLANGRIFLLMAGCGFDADVVRRVHERRTGHISRRTYFKHVVQAICSYEYPEIRVHWEEEDEAVPPLSARWMFVFNLPCYGGGFRIAPQADGSDGLLDLCTLRRGRLWPGLWYAAAVLAGAAPTSDRLDDPPRAPAANHLRRPSALSTRRRSGRDASAGGGGASRPVDLGRAKRSRGARRCETATG